MDEKIIKKILATVAYYDVLDYPLTSLEIWKYLIRTDYSGEDGNSQSSLGEIRQALRDDKTCRFLENYRGFYFLKGRKGLVGERLRRNKTAILKFRQLRQVAALLVFVPFVRTIGVTGKLAMKHTRAGSDWDVLIILKSGRIWIGRTLVTLVTHLVGKRRHGNLIRNRVCLNYYITDKSLEIRTKDLFSAHEYSFFFPLFNTPTFKLFQVKNGWIRDFKPNFSPTDVAYVRTLEDNLLAKTIRRAGETLLDFDFIENRLRAWQHRRIMKNPKTHQKESLVDATDEALVFLPEPRGPQVFEKFKERIGSLSAR